MWIIVGPNNVGAFPYCLSTRSLCLYVVGVTKKFPILNVVSMHSTDAGRNFVVQNRTKSLSVTCYKTGWLGGYLDTSYRWLFLPSSLDILINSHISSLSFYGFAFRLASLTCCLFLGKSPCDWNPSTPPAFLNTSSYT